MQNIAGHCQQAFENKMFDDITQQCSALLPRVNFTVNNLNFHWRKHLNSLALKLKFFYSSYRDYPRPKWPKSAMASFWNWRFWRVEFTNDSWFYWLYGYSQEEICYIKRARSWWPGNYLCLPIYSKPLSYLIKCSQKMLHSSKLQSTRLVLFSVA